MNYISWAIYVEGSTDADYFSSLIPRCIEHIISQSQGSAAEVPDAPAAVFGMSSRNFAVVSGEICKAKDAFELLFVHGDSGGRAIQETLDQRTSALVRNANEQCNVRLDRCITIAPRKETEAWCLADVSALRGSFGVPAGFNFPMLPLVPAGVESLQDPKITMQEVIASLPGRRKGKFPFSAVAQSQNINGSLLTLHSFRVFYEELAIALATFGYRCE